jgi:glutathione S-transferase
VVRSDWRELYTFDSQGEAQWDENETAKTWNARIKSRPSFRLMLAERLPGLSPSVACANLDF